jgi:hypothetical protein
VKGGSARSNAVMAGDAVDTGAPPGCNDGSGWG